MENINKLKNKLQNKEDALKRDIPDETKERIKKEIEELKVKIENIEKEKKENPSDDTEAPKVNKKGIKIYIVQECSIRHGGRVFNIGNEIDLTDEEAGKISKNFIKLKGGK